MITFREKKFSLKDDVTAGLIIGGIVGAGGVPVKKGINALSGETLIKNDSRVGKILGNPVASTVAGSIVGAALGGLYYLFKSVTNKSTSLNERKLNLPKDIVTTLTKFGYKEGFDFTFDPKKANDLKTKVCIVISRTSDDMTLIINSISDPKLESISKQIIKTLPNTSVITRRKSDKWNELTISSLSTNNGDSGFISILAEKFIQRKYPVYLVEVG